MASKKQGVTIYPSSNTIELLCAGRVSTTRLCLATNLFAALIAEQADHWPFLSDSDRETFGVLVLDMDFSYTNLHVNQLLASRAELLGYKSLGEYLSRLTGLEVWAMIFRHVLHLPGQIRKETA